MVSDASFFILNHCELTYPQDLVFKNQAMNSRKSEGGQFVNDLLRTEFHKCVQIQNTLGIETYTALQKIYDQVHQGMRYHPVCTQHILTGLPQ
jgi:hypothetical protein